MCIRDSNCFVASSFPGPNEAGVIRDLGVDNVMWGSDYPHHEATTPYTRESLRHAFSDWDRDELQTLLAGTAARVYGFDLEALAPIAADVGPTHAEVTVPLDRIPADATSPAFLRP